jgi:outer membrane receptor protein involved in Fe transport
LSLLAARADAAESRHRLVIPPKPYADALIDLGLQANVSVVGVSACGTGGRVGLSGAYTLEQALRRLTEGSPCVWRIVEGRSVLISPRPAEPVVREPIQPTTLVGEVLVTATKRPVLAGSLAAGVSVITRSQLELTAARDVTDTTGQLAGVLTTNLGPGRDKLLMRGISDGAFTGRARSTVSTYLDDSPINYNAPDPALRLVDIDRIEVLRGPQGALYGSGAMSGIYRIVTRKPELDRFGGGGMIALSATRHGEPSREIEGYLNLPISRESAALRLVAYHEVQGGYLDDVNLGISNVDRSVREGGRAALRLRLSDSWEVDVAATGQRLRSSDTQYTTAPFPRDVRANNVREAHKNDFLHGALTIEGELSWATLTSSLSYVHHTYGSHYDATSSIDFLRRNNLSLPARSVAIYIERAQVDMWVHDLVLRSPGGESFDWLAGVYAADTDEQTPGALHVARPTGDFEQLYRERRRNGLRELALYGEGSWTLAAGWSLSAGGRVFETRVRTVADVQGVSGLVLSHLTNSSREFAGFSPKISIQKETEAGDLFYVLYSEGFRPGGFNSSGFVPIRQARMRFAPDRLRNYEAGAKLRLLNRRLGLRATAYYGEWSNIQTDQYRPTGLSYTANVGDARLWGLETEVGYDFDFGLSLQANALFADSEMTRKNPDFANGARITNELPGTPKASGGVLVTYERPLPHDLTLRLAGEIAYVGRSSLSFNAQLPTRSGDYLRTELSAEVAAAAWSAAVFVSNPANEDGDTFAYGNPFSFGTVRQITPQRPRTIGLRLAAAF